ncbi:MAG TPA: lipopolysaccharide heptosyltransferase II [Holophagaceae bacterium]|nr:lipopolysaccharide heptosyltransferase II [Holophagaceae bacterium]
MRILIRSLNWLGDAVMQAPALRLLKALRPGAELVFVAKPAVAEVVKAYGLGTVLPWSPKLLERARLIREAEADAALVLPKSFGTAMEVFLGRVPERWGWSAQGRRPLLTRALPRWDDSAHYALRFRALVAGALQAGSDLPTTVADLAPPLEWKAAAAPFLRDDGRPMALLAPGAAGGTAKQWPLSSWTRLAQRLAEEGIPVAVIGRQEEAELGRAMTEAVPGLLDLTGKTSLAALGGLLAEASLVVANDSGTMHLAAALGAPTLGIFGPTSPRTSHPLGRNARALWAEVECAPCYLRECPIDHRCMARLDPESIWPIAASVLEGEAPVSPLLAPRPALPGII